MSVSACPNCGSTKIYQGRLKDGVLTGYSNRYVCRNCGYQGSPIIFESSDEYKNFINNIKKKDSQKKKEDLKDENIKLSDKEKEIIDFLKEYEEDQEKEEQEDPFEDKPSGIKKNPVTSLGFVLFLVGILVTAVTSGSFIFFTGLLVLIGIILFIVGIIGPTDKELMSDQRKNKMNVFPKIAGVLLLFSGFISLFYYIWFYLILTTSSFEITAEFELLLEELIPMMVGFSIIMFVFAIIGIIGGLFSFYKKRWFVAVICSIICSFIFLPYFISTIGSVIALILIAYSRHIFVK